jgi:cyclase
MTRGLLPRVVSLLPVSNGHLCRTKMFQPDYEYTDRFLDLRNFDEVMAVRVDPIGDDPDSHLAFSRFIDGLRPNCFLPLTLGGHISSVSHASKLFDLGADRIVVGSAALRDRGLIGSLSARWGSQAVVAGVATRWLEGTLVAVDSRDPNTPVQGAAGVLRDFQESGAGEILINSVDRDGSLSGLDREGIASLLGDLAVPYLLAGGVGNWNHMREGIAQYHASGVVTSNIYHLTAESVSAAKRYLEEQGIAIRIGHSYE